jgi:NADH dehydrogenase/NADH:ubiquinone oxidoreductase subunit G
MVNLTIDRKKVSVPEGTTVLEAARSLGVEIPTLCHHMALSPYGACRICLVEVSHGGRDRLQTACICRVEPGMKVRTNSEKVVKTRKIVMELLLARNPKDKRMKEAAKQLGVKKTRFDAMNEDCILCGLCVRACQEIAGVGAINFAYRGDGREAVPPFERASSVCVGCGTCIYMCPTGAIKLVDVVDTPSQHRWKSDFKRVKCRICGDYHLEPDYKSELLKQNG